MNQWEVIYEYCDDHPGCTNDACEKIVLVQPVASATPSAQAPATKRLTFRMPIPASQFLGISLMAIGMGGVLGPMVAPIRLESSYLVSSLKEQAVVNQSQAKPLPKSVPVVFNPLVTPDGASIAPVNTDFALIVPKVGINAAIEANVDPSKASVYDEALKKGVAHASTSFFPDQDGTVYLFSHSTNYDWFVKDLNAVFYLLKNLQKGDTIVIIYKGKQYTYVLRDKKVVSPTDTSYLVPIMGKRNLILQTCWPPGSTTERLLLFADLVDTNGQQI